MSLGSSGEDGVAGATGVELVGKNDVEDGDNLRVRGVVVVDVGLGDIFVEHINVHFEAVSGVPEGSVFINVAAGVAWHPDVDVGQGGVVNGDLVALGLPVGEIEVFGELVELAVEAVLPELDELLERDLLVASVDGGLFGNAKRAGGANSIADVIDLILPVGTVEGVDIEGSEEINVVEEASHFFRHAVLREPVAEVFAVRRGGSLAVVVAGLRVGIAESFGVVVPVVAKLALLIQLGGEVSAKLNGFLRDFFVEKHTAALAFSQVGGDSARRKVN